MSQTLLAVGALGLLAVLTLNTHRRRALTDRDGVTTETVAQANRVATDVLDGYRALPFDAVSASAPASAPAALHAHAPLAAAPPARFADLAARAAAAGGAAAGTLAGLDGDHRYVLRPGPQGALSYEVATVVGYVGADGRTPSATPTPLKMATVRVRPVIRGGAPLYVSQLYACGGACDW